jgi:hypothetical protein
MGDFLVLGSPMRNVQSLADSVQSVCIFGRSWIWSGMAASVFFDEVDRRPWNLAAKVLNAVRLDR